MRDAQNHAELVIGERQRPGDEARGLEPCVDEPPVGEQREPAESAREDRDPERDQDAELDKAPLKPRPAHPDISDGVGRDDRQDRHDQADAKGAQEHRENERIGDEPLVLPEAWLRQRDAPRRHAKKRDGVDERKEHKQRRHEADAGHERVVRPLRALGFARRARRRRCDPHRRPSRRRRRTTRQRSDASISCRDDLRIGVEGRAVILRVPGHVERHLLREVGGVDGIIFALVGGNQSVGRRIGGTLAQKVEHDELPLRVRG